MTYAPRSQYSARQHYEQTHPRLTRMLVELLAAGCQVLRAHDLQDDTLGLGFEQFVCAEALSRDIGEPTFLRALAAFEAVQRLQEDTKLERVIAADALRPAVGTFMGSAADLASQPTSRRASNTGRMLQVLTELWSAGERVLAVGPTGDAAQLRVHLQAFVLAAGACRGLQSSDLLRQLGGLA